MKLGWSINVVTIKQDEAVIAITQHPRPKWIGHSNLKSIKRSLSGLTLISKTAVPLIVLIASRLAALDSQIQKDKKILPAPHSKIQRE